MIHYNLRCACGHAFDSWFQSSAAYDSQIRRKLVNCPACGSPDVDKAIMAPRIARKSSARTSGVAVTDNAEAATPGTTPLMMAKELELRAKLKELRDHVTKNADNVGERFPEEARKIHYGDAEHRPIYGEASLDDARALIDEGIEVAPLPVLPDDRN